MVDLSGYWFIDGIDLWKNFSLGIEKGTADFLRYPPKKESISHDWPDQNGIDVDLSKFYLKERDGVLTCRVISYSESDFWQKHDAFISLLTKPGIRRFTLKSHGMRSYMVYYQECSNYKQVKGLKGIDANLVVHEFNLRLIEPQPQMQTSDTFIVVEGGAFLIT